MSLGYIERLNKSKGGFNFDNGRRNDILSVQMQGENIKCPLKTGTTICGVQCRDGVVLGADTRATMGLVVADKYCEKLHKLAENMYCAGAGVSADLMHTTALMKSKLELLRLVTKTQPRICSVVNMLSQLLFKYQGHVTCALIVGGVDIWGPQLYKVHPHGSTDRLPFAAMGSGSLCAEGFLEAGYTDDMTIEQGKELVASAIRSGILNDLGSGGNVDLVVLEKHKTSYLRSYGTPEAGKKRITGRRKFISGTTAVLLEQIKEIKSKVYTVTEETNQNQDVDMISLNI